LVLQVKHFNNQLGFTLIELVMVIILLGILAATALLKFASLSVQARNASNQGVAGALGAAVGIAHAAWVVNGAPTTTGGTTINLDGNSVHLNSLGWSDHSTGVSPTPKACSAIGHAVLSNPPIAGCSTCNYSCLSTDTHCYITMAAGSVCTFATSVNPLVTITYDLNNGKVGYTSN
jgi:MSHA pilin protein MshB